MPPEMLIPAIAAIGFGIQQFLQVVVDPLASAGISMVRNRQQPQPDGSRVLPGGISDVDAKKMVLGATSFTLGLLIVGSSDGALLVLNSLNVQTLQSWDPFISALTVGAGTEGANSTLKLFQYAKDAVKNRTPPSVALNSPVPQQPAAPLAAGAGAAARPALAAPGPVAAPEVGEEERTPTPNSGDDEDAEDEAGALTARDMAAPPAASLGLAADEAQTWRVAECLLTLKSQVDAMAPARNKASDGFIGDAAHKSRKSDHNPWVVDGSKGVVTAFDITHDPARGCDAGKIAEAVRKSQDARVKYIIWNRQIANSAALDGHPAWAWRKYNGTNPHTAHVHISVKPQKTLYDSRTAWRV